MRINPITARTNYYSSPAISKTKNEVTPEGRTDLVDLNHLNLTCNQSMVNFKATIDISRMLIKQIPLDDKLASLFQNFKLGDMILVGKNLHECAKEMYKSAGLVKNTIKRGFFIQDETLGGKLGFLKTLSEIQRS